MGLRGIGAKAIKRPKSAAKPKATRKEPWRKAGLSRAQRVVAYIETLPVTSGPLAGTNIKLRPSQVEFIEKVYRTDASGRRPVRTAVNSQGRKGGKTTLAACLALTHLAGPEAEQRGECYSAANDKDQAGRIFAELVAIIDRKPELSERINVIRHTKKLEVVFGDGEGSIFHALSADVGAKDGLNPSFVIYDELGASRNRTLLDLLDTAMGGRDEPLMVVISTQGPDDACPLSQMIDYGLKVEAGEIEDPSFSLTLFTAPPEADPFDPETWKLANPALGDFRSMEDVERQALQAQRMPAKLPAFKNKILNQRVTGEVTFLSPSEWEACGGQPDPDAAGDVYAGLDIGGTRDPTALVRLIRRADGTFDVMPMFWIPGDDIAEREDKDGVPYRAWRDAGLVRLTPGKTLNAEFVAHEVARLHRQRPFKALVYDRWRIEDMTRYLAELGVTDLPLVPHGQGYKDFSGACDALERAVADRLLRHGGNPMLRSHVSNARIEIDPAGNRKITKARSTGRVDGCVALAMVVNIASKPAEPEPKRRIPQFVA